MSTIYEDPTLYERQHLPETFYTATLDAIIEKYGVKTAADFGCGLGVDAAMMLAAGLDAYGIDGSAALRPHLLFDTKRYVVLNLEHRVRWSADLIWCREVAEHLPTESAGALIKNIVRNGRVAYFTAAPPEQPGYQHINPQPRQFWIDLFEAHCWHVDDELTKLNGRHPIEDDRVNGMVVAA